MEWFLATYSRFGRPGASESKTRSICCRFYLFWRDFCSFVTLEHRIVMLKDVGKPTAFVSVQLKVSVRNHRHLKQDEDWQSPTLASQWCRRIKGSTPFSRGVPMVPMVINRDPIKKDKHINQACSDSRSGMGVPPLVLTAAHISQCWWVLIRNIYTYIYIHTYLDSIISYLYLVSKVRIFNWISETGKKEEKIWLIWSHLCIHLSSHSIQFHPNVRPTDTLSWIPYKSCSQLMLIPYGYKWLKSHMRVSINGGTPIAGWLIMENPFINGWWFVGTPMTQETSI